MHRCRGPSSSAGGGAGTPPAISSTEFRIFSSIAPEHEAYRCDTIMRNRLIQVLSDCGFVAKRNVASSIHNSQKGFKLWRRRQTHFEFCRGEWSGDSGKGPWLRRLATATAIRVGENSARNFGPFKAAKFWNSGKF